jgi:hypothetical protein
VTIVQWQNGIPITVYLPELGDLLALKVALAPCVIGYAEIGTPLASRPDTLRCNELQIAFGYCFQRNRTRTAIP